MGAAEPVADFGVRRETQGAVERGRPAGRADRVAAVAVAEGGGLAVKVEGGAGLASGEQAERLTSLLAVLARGRPVRQMVEFATHMVEQVAALAQPPRRDVGLQLQVG